MQGFGTPHCTNVVMPFAERPPRVPERNPTGVYRRTFTLPRGWRGRTVRLHVSGVEGVVHVVVDGGAGRSREGLADAGGVRRHRARPGGAERALAMILLAARFGVPVCPHAGGVGLCEYVQHLSLFDYVCVSADLTDRVIEYVDHPHEHFVNPVVLQAGCYMPPREAGYSAELHAESLADHSFPGGKIWA